MRNKKKTRYLKYIIGFHFWSSKSFTDHLRNIFTQYYMEYPTKYNAIFTLTGMTKKDTKAAIQIRKIIERLMRGTPKILRI
jgi:hypothetical protein